MKRAIHFVNIPRHICRALIGEHHTHGHRMVAGAVLMTLGVTVSHVAGGTGILLVVYAGDLLGYAIHGIGVVPFLDFLLEEASQDDNN